MKKILLFLLCGICSAYAQPGDTDSKPVGKYASENALLQTTPDARRIVLMGDSITELWKVIDGKLFTGSYINRGISGQTTAQMLLRFREDVIDLRPKLVVIMGGTNDIALNDGPLALEDTFGHIVSMVQLAKSNKIRVVLCSVLPAYDFKWRPEVAPAEKIVKLNAMLKRYAAKNKITYIDYHSAMKDARNGMKEGYAEDGVHPNLDGYSVMKPLLLKGIAQALKRK
ncbi:MAG TPA: SGNH/GDSL hydrolase family protein [Flavobacterium sp.]|nr:SGNH/GDSL hydrolase family protein [Flavobacterium sp.]HPJ09559.1 SGNH/GDSL hydrolase family protein [Flavobacterium sp.]